MMDRRAFLELEDGELPSQSVPGDVATGAPEALGERGQLTLQGAVEADGQSGSLHV